MTFTRNHSNDRRRAIRLENLHRLAAELQLRTMYVSDVCAFLGMGRTGAKSYINHLINMLDVTPGPTNTGGNSYRMTGAPEQIAAFLASLGTVRKAPGSTTQVAAASRHGRQFHILADDAPYHVKVGRVRIPEAWEVMAAFYGMEVRA